MNSMFPTYSGSSTISPDSVQFRDFDAINKRIIDEMWKVRQSSKWPATLYHYTTPAGFKGIIESGVLRATHLSYANDGGEVLHAAKIARLCALERRQVATVSQEIQLLEAIAAWLEKTTPFNTLPMFISCFCENGNLLSQWRGYGLGEGGIAIGFDTKKIIDAITSWQWQPYLVPVIYDEIEQRRLGANLIAEVVSEYDKLLKSRTITDPSAYMSEYLLACSIPAVYAAPLCKDDGFKEEKEWRLIYALQRSDKVKYSAKASHLSPFLELPIGTKHSNRPDAKREQEANALPITEVWFGPGRFQDLARHSCSALLAANGYNNITIRSSTTPFRSIA